MGTELAVTGPSSDISSNLGSGLSEVTPDAKSVTHRNNLNFFMV